MNLRDKQYKTLNGEIGAVQNLHYYSTTH